jgi:DNA-binding transcriptional ArsR family regulator
MVSHNNIPHENKKSDSMDFVSKYVDLLSKITDAPSEFQEAAALFLLSTAVGRKWVFRSIPEASIFSEDSKICGRLLNFWFILIGKSRITRKTSGVMSHVSEILQKIFGKPHMISEAFTPESLVEQMSKMSEFSMSGERETACSWTADEIAWFFQQLRKKDSYMVSAEALLSKIYDGSTYSRSTISRGIETILNPYLTCLLASTEYLPALFDEAQVRFGFLNRFIFVLAHRKERKQLRTELLTEEEKQEAKDIESFLKNLAERDLITILEMSNEAKRAYDSFEEQIEKQIAEENLDIKEGYCGQLPNLVVRLSCLYRISRMKTEEIKVYSNPVLVVEVQDVQRSIDYVQKAWGWFEIVLEIMQSGEKTRSPLPIENAKTVIMEFLSEGVERHVNVMKTYVIERTGVSQATFYNALRLLLDAGKVVRTRPDYYRIVKKEDGGAEGEKK